MSYSFNLGEYLDEDKVSSSVTSSKEVLSEETRNRLRDVLLMFEKNISDLVQDTNSMQRVLLAIKSNPSPALSRILSSLSIFEVQALKVEKAQRNHPIVKLYWPRGNSTSKRLKR